MWMSRLACKLDQGGQVAYIIRTCHSGESHLGLSMFSLALFQIHK